MKIIIDLGWIEPFFNSNFFVALSTMITGIAAYIVYIIQKNDNKINSAKIILSEIRNAEIKIKEVKKRISGSTYEDFPTVLPSNNWNKFSYLFANDFDRDQLDKINLFFSNCQSIDDMASKDNNFFWITAEERARVVQQQLPQIIVAAIDKNSGLVNQSVLTTLKQTYLDTLSNESYAYVPKKTVNAIKTLLEGTDKLTDSPIGEKFKLIASGKIRPTVKKIR